MYQFSQESARQLTLEIVQQYLTSYRSQLADVMKVVDNLDQDAYMRLMSSLRPEASRLSEMLTREEKVERGQELARAVAVAQAVVFGLTFLTA